MEKRAFLAVILSLGILIAVPPLMTRFFPQLKTQERANSVVGKKMESRSLQEPPEIYKNTDGNAEKPFEQPMVSAGKDVHFVTEDYEMVFSNLSAGIKKISLKKYQDPETKKAIELFDISSPENSIFYISDLDDELNGLKPYAAAEKRDGIIFSVHTSSGLFVEKEITIKPDTYVLELRQTIRNNSNFPKTLKYKITAGSGISNLSAHDDIYVEVVRNIGGKINNTNKKAVKGQMSWDGGDVRWVSLKNRYFSLIVNPPTDFSTIYSNSFDNKNLRTQIETASFEINPNSSITHKFILYAGPNDIKEMRSLKLGFEDSLFLGFTGGIGRMLFMALQFFKDVVKNWGLAIILLTTFINIVLFPLTFKSLKSMKQMQALQPKIESLRETYKGNPQKLNREIMEIYKKYKVNPLGGCLPMLLQMPVFFALYQVLMKSIELRGANFLWICDLSQPDRLIGNLPMFPGELNILPLLMAIAMFLQQKFSMPTRTSGSGASDQMVQQQKMMMFMMPVLFGILFYKLPSGLVLYWFVNTILTMFEQAIFLKPHLFHVEHLDS